MMKKIVVVERTNLLGKIGENRVNFLLVLFGYSTEVHHSRRTNPSKILRSYRVGSPNLSHKKELHIELLPNKLASIQLQSQTNLEKSFCLTRRSTLFTLLYPIIKNIFTFRKYLHFHSI